MIEGAIFDLDGTILDSMALWDTIGEEYLLSRGIAPRENLAETFRTFTLRQAAEYYREHYDIKDSVQEIVDGINGMMAEKYRTRVTLKPGVGEFLNRLQRANVKMCIATVTDRDIAEEALRRLKVRDYFSEIFTCAQVGHSKETPEIYRKALAHLGTEKEKTMVFEDSFHALKTAKADGFRVAAVYDGHQAEPEELKEMGDEYIEDFGTFCFRTTMKKALAIAGSDSSGGAGIQADLKTMTMHGVYGMSAITALTAQNTLGVRGILDVTPDFLKKQLDAVFEDIFPDSVKIGMVSSGELIDVIADRLNYYHAKNIVVDPVMVATSGSALIKADAIKELTTKLLPIATLVTPNIPEAEILSGIKICDREAMVKAARHIGENYGCSVLLKGGHSLNDASDLLYEKETVIWFQGKRMDNPNTHGTGCTLSSAIAANLAKGESLEESVKKAKEYVSSALLWGLDLGKGSGPLRHCWGIREGK